MDTFGDDFKVPQRAVRKAYEVEHESLPQSAVEKLMAADIEHISGIFGVDVCDVLLAIFRIFLIPIRRQAPPRCYCAT